METIMAALVNTINRQGDFIREQNQRIMAQNQRLAAVEESREARVHEDLGLPKEATA
ncbi:hypothetical protein A2U01_0017863 [Trifolium medium]|uniref:Uncharacterized protein n=1 Tax=Trifolium medium TaxID=97028 RepID=A0A392NB12_9FABA|nr:hypothetical protein [Trifolium medium]